MIYQPPRADVGLCLMSRHILLLDANLSRYDALRPLAQARAWSITRVTDAAEAIQEFERQQQHVAIIDLATIHPDEDALLRTIRMRWPTTGLMAISPAVDYAGQAAPMLAPIAHQYLGPNVALDEMALLVERSLGLQDILSQPALQAVIGGIRELPSRPRIFMRLQMLLRHEKVTSKKISALLEEDAAIAAKVLQLANCVLFHHSGRVKNIEQAVLRLGHSRLGSLVMSAEVLVGWSRVSGQDPDLTAMQAHGQQVAMVTAALMNDAPGSDEAVLAALLHDIGYWVLAQEYPQELREAAQLAQSTGISMHEAETQVLGTCHAEIGAYLLGLWGLPLTLVEAVAYHHAPERLPVRRFNTLAALVVALALAGTDDSDAFKVLPRRNNVVGRDFLDQIKDSPFVWSDAARIAAACLSSVENLRF